MKKTVFLCSLMTFFCNNAMNISDYKKVSNRDNDIDLEKGPSIIEKGISYEERECYLEAATCYKNVLEQYRCENGHKMISAEDRITRRTCICHYAYLHFINKINLPDEYIEEFESLMNNEKNYTFLKEYKKSYPIKGAVIENNLRYLWLKKRCCNCVIS